MLIYVDARPPGQIFPLEHTCNDLVRHATGVFSLSTVVIYKLITKLWPAVGLYNVVSSLCMPTHYEVYGDAHILYSYV